MLNFKFSMGQKVKLKCDKSRITKGSIGVVTAIYDRKMTPGQYPLSDYRVTFGPKQNGNDNQAYVSESEIDDVKTIKAYCYQNKKTKQMSWNSLKTVKNQYTVRMPEFDFEKEILD